jgi:hypothetical protein
MPNKIEKTSQSIDNLSFDEEYQFSGNLIYTENSEGTAISPQKTIATSENQLAQTTQSSEEALLLRRMLKLMESGGVNDFQGRQRVALDAITTALTLSIVTTVGNVNLIAGYNPLIEAMTASRNSYANSIRNNITFS